MGESKRRKQLLGSAYGILTVDDQVKDAWHSINTSMETAKRDGTDTIVCQCTRNGKGFTLEAIQRMEQELKGWECPLDIPILIQMLPQGFRSSETKLFDGFMNVWCNTPEYKLWKELLQVKIPISNKKN